MNLNFRSALNGFNRQDVARYLEYLNAQHTAQINRLTTDLENLSRKAEEAENAPQDPRVRELEEKCRQQEAQIVSLQAQESSRVRELETQLAAMQAQRDEALRQRDEVQREAVVQVSGARLDSSQELEAYRRAERAERVAKERANLIYAQTGAVLNQASNRVDGAVRQVTGIAQEVSAQLDTLQSAIAASRLALQDAAETIERLKPKQE